MAEDGTLTDLGNLTLMVGTFIHRHIHDYEDGESYGASVATPKPNGKASKDNAGSKLQLSDITPQDIGTVQIGVVKANGQTLATVGSGNITADEIIGGEVARDVTNAQTYTEETNIQIDVKIQRLPDELITPQKLVESVVRNVESLPGEVVKTLDQIMALFEEEVQQPELEQDESIDSNVKKKSSETIKKKTEYIDPAQYEEEKSKLNKDEKEALDKLEQEIKNEPLKDQAKTNEYLHRYLSGDLSEIIPNDLAKGKLSNLAAKVKVWIVQYAKFSEENPNLAKYGLSVIIIAAKTIMGAAQGGGVRAIISAAYGLLSEVKGVIVSEVAGDAINSAIDKASQTSAPGLMKLDSTLNEADAELLSKFAILATSSGKDLSDGLKSFGKSLKHAFKPRHAMAGAGGVDIDDYMGNNGGVGDVDDIALFAKQYPDGVQKVGGRYPINGDFAGKIFHFADPELAKLYPKGVEFSPEGFPIFTPYATHRVEIEYTGNRRSDKIAANAAAGLKNEPDGYTWHHHHDTKTMELIPKRLHETLSHTGGFAANKHKR